MKTLTIHIKRLIYMSMSALLVVPALFLPAKASAASPAVTPINWGLFTSGLPTDANSTRMATILNNTNRYALTTWWNTAKNYDVQTGNYLDFGGIGESNIRPPASEALALATSVKTGAFNPAVAGTDLYSAETKAAKLFRSLAYRHKINLTGGWGGDWQTGLWAAYVGTAGWMMWDSPYMTATDRENLRQVVEYEANRYIGYRVPNYRDATGKIVIIGDSKAEENSWNAMVLMTALSMMPNHANWHAWNYKAHEMMTSSFSRPSNVSSSSQINGRALAHWLYGSNMNDDGTVVNHSIVHPDYMTTISQNIYAALTSSLAHRQTPRAATFNSTIVYDALVDLNFVAGSAYPPGPAIAAPGGTIYVDNSANIYYPQGNDWGTSRRMHFALVDAQAQALGYDSAASQKGSYWEPYHAQMVLNMQNANADRRTYNAAGQDVYAGREEWVAAHAAQAYLTKWLVQQNVIATNNNAIPIVVDNLDREFSMPGGTWTLSTPTDRLGPNVRYIAAGTGTGRARWTPRITNAGNYRVYAWWTAYPNHATNAPYVIRHATGTSTVRVNQEVSGGQWNLLGTFNLAAGSGNYVELNNSANEFVVADGLMFEAVP